MSKKRLGRGLDALLSERSVTSQTAPSAETAVEPPRTGEQGSVALDDINPSPYQPRRQFPQEALQELADSIARQGLLQPVVVRARAQGGYELIAGERRWRAARLAGLTTIPDSSITISWG